MSKIGLIAFAAAIALAGVSYADEKITFTCSGTMSIRPNAAKSAVNTSLVIDLDNGVVTGDIGWCGSPCSFFSITQVTETRIEFEAQNEQGIMDRTTGSLSVTDEVDGYERWTMYDATCKPAEKSGGSYHPG